MNKLENITNSYSYNNKQAFYFLEDLFKNYEIRLHYV